MNIQPLGARLLVKELENKEEKIGSIYVPDPGKEKSQQGLVMAVGPGKVLESGMLVPLDVAVGDTIIFAKFSGMKVRDGGEDFLLLNAEDVLAKVL